MLYQLALLLDYFTELHNLKKISIQSVSRLTHLPNLYPKLRNSILWVCRNR